jgi:hypothetical protein
MASGYRSARHRDSRPREEYNFGRCVQIRRGQLPMKKLGEIALGVVTSVGGFLEIGSLTTAAQAGAAFG